MPKAMEQAIEKSAEARGYSEERATYGRMNNTGYMKGSKITAKGRAWEKKHAAGPTAEDAEQAMLKRHAKKH